MADSRESVHRPERSARAETTSPERLIESRHGQVQTRPIAGTHPRVGDDRDVIAALSAHPKERAEHVMLLDLERSDLGRIAEAGSVSVAVRKSPAISLSVAFID